MKKKSEKQEPNDRETVEACLRVYDMFHFENIGFSKLVGTLKYLVCADCEAGPLGLRHARTHAATAGTSHTETIKS